MRSVSKVRVGQSVLDIHVFAPAEGKAILAAVILMFPRSGLDGFPERWAEALTALGHVVLIPDVTHRIPGDVPVRDRKRLLTDEGILEDVAASLSFLEASGYCNKPRFIMGHCMGGRNALLGASAFEFAGAVVFYGGKMFDPWGGTMAPFGRLRHIRCPILGFFGGKDKNPSPADVERIEMELTRTGVQHKFVMYPDVGHAFQQNATRSPEERSAANDSFEQTATFLAHLTTMAIVRA